MTSKASINKAKNLPGIRSAVFIFLFSIVVYFFVRLPSLTNIPVFVDEAIYVRWSQIMKNEATLRFLPLSDGKQPLFMWLTIPFLKFFPDPLVAGRMVSIVAGFSSLVGLSLLASLLFNSLWIGSLTGLLYSITPFAVFFDRMALVDSLLASTGIWTLVLAVVLAKTRRLDVAMILGFTIGTGLITKSPAIFFYPWVFFAFVFLARPKSHKDMFRFFGLFLVSVFISQCIYNVLRLGPGFNMIGSRNQDYVFKFSEVLTHPFNPLWGNTKTTLFWLFSLLTPTFLVFLFVAFYSGFRDKQLVIPSLTGNLYKKSLRPSLFLLLCAALPLLAQASIAKVYTSRYILFASLLLIPLAALGLYRLWQVRNIFIKSLTLISLSVPLYLSLAFVYLPISTPMPFDMRNGYLEEWTAGWGQKEIANYLINRAKNKNVVVFTEGYFGTLPDGLQIYTEGVKNITVVGSAQPVHVLPEGLVKTSPDNEIYFVLNQSRNRLKESDKKRLKLIQSFPKPIRNDGTREVLEFYQYLPKS